MKPLIGSREPAAVALIGFGEVGQILATDLAAAGVGGIAVYDLQFSDPSSPPRRAAESSAVMCCSTAAEAVADAHLILCAVTAACDLDAAKAVASGVKSDALYVDLNSASPVMKRAAAEIIEGAGARYVEAAVMTPFPPKRIASPMLLGGRHAEAFLEIAGPLGFCAEVFSKDIGQASATKMCRSVMIKGIEALLTESLLAARRYGVEAAVLGSLYDLLPVGDWPKLAQYMISRSLTHGKRRAEEMREAVRTLEDVDIAPLMSRAIAERQDWAAGHSMAATGELGAMLDAISKSIDASRSPPL
jgi:3-hydroxyisobutyrate dehydrogenase-like beta-hydroxyacid dehydrogenase